MDRAYQSEILGAIYEDALANFEVGAISAAELREYEEACLTGETKDEPVAEAVVAS